MTLLILNVTLWVEFVWLFSPLLRILGLLVCEPIGLTCSILAAEVLIVGAQSGRLSWPYGDLVPGNYLTKVRLSAFVVVVAFATSLKGGLARIGAVVALLSIVLSILTGERINFLLRACSGMIAALSWKPKWRRVLLIIAAEIIAFVVLIQIQPDLKNRYVDNFIYNLPTHT